MIETMKQAAMDAAKKIEVETEDVGEDFLDDLIWVSKYLKHVCKRFVSWGAMAQLVAHPTPDREVGSSILSGVTLFLILQTI